jgi:hypothetical protein
MIDGMIYYAMCGIMLWIAIDIVKNVFFGSQKDAQKPPPQNPDEEMKRQIVRTTSAPEEYELAKRMFNEAFNRPPQNTPTDIEVLAKFYNGIMRAGRQQLPPAWPHNPYYGGQ